jgi:hypothetical protein
MITYTFLNIKDHYMTKQKLQRAELAIIFLLTGVGFILWTGCLGILWLLFKVIGLSVDYWAMTESLSTAVAAAAVLSAGFIAYREIKIQDISRHIEVADRLFNEMNSEENIEARRWVFQNLPSDPEIGIRELNDTGRKAVKKVLNSLDRVAFLTREGWIPNELIMPWMSPMIVKSWAKLQPYVDFEAERRKESDYYKAVGELAQKCINWRSKNIPEAELIWLDDAL